MVKEKLKFAFYWAASCGGCEIAVLDVNEKILENLPKLSEVNIVQARGKSIRF